MRIRCCLAAAITGMFLANSGMAGTITNYVWCQVLVTNTTGRLAIEVTPPTWLLGSVPAGGVRDTWTQGGPGKFKVTNSGDVPAYVHVVTGTDGGPYPLFPAGSLPVSNNCYVMAFATNVTGLLPSWNLLDKDYPFGWEGGNPAYGAVVANLLSGEYVLLDLKFWAPPTTMGMYPLQNQSFRVRFEAANYPLW